MEQIILNNAPDYWIRSITVQSVELDDNVEEYRQIKYEVLKSLGNTNHQEITSIQRYQSIYDYGQFLIRAQLLAHMHTVTYYKVRRFIVISKHNLKLALDYNIDHRRCGLRSIVFQKTLSGASITSDSIVLVVQVLTHDPHADAIVPDNSSNYFIDYIVRF